MSVREWKCDDRICHHCVGSHALKHWIKTDGGKKQCVNCGRRAYAITLDDLASRVDQVYREMYRPGADGYDGQQGDYPEEIIRGLLQDDGTDIPEALAKYLNAGEWHDVIDGGDEFYGSGSRYVEVDFMTHPFELTESWIEFESRIKYGRRFFDEDVSRYLGELMQLIRDVDSGRGRDETLIYSLKRGTEVYRAREAQTIQEVVKIQRNPQRELGPAPRELRLKGGRMNAPGICTLYGALDPETCVAEMKPSVGSYVVVGRFKLLRSAKVLDLTRLDNVSFIGDPFDSGHLDTVRLLRFLATFHDIVSQPVHPTQESIAYVPTQVVADYLANVGGVEGVIFRSAQRGKATNEFGEEITLHKNIAIFNAEASVRQRKRTAQLATRSVWESQVPNFTESQPPLLSFVRGSEDTFVVDEAAPRTHKLYVLSRSTHTPVTVLDFND